MTARTVDRPRGRAQGTLLTPREERSLAYALFFGTSTACRIMGIAESTLKNRLTLVYRKLGADSRAQAAYKYGWLTLPEGLIDPTTLTASERESLER